MHFLFVAELDNGHFTKKARLLLLLIFSFYHKNQRSQYLKSVKRKTFEIDTHTYVGKKEVQSCGWSYLISFSCLMLDDQQLRVHWTPSFRLLLMPGGKLLHLLLGVGYLTQRHNSTPPPFALGVKTIAFWTLSCYYYIK